MNKQNKNLKELIKRLKRAKEATSFSYSINKHDVDNIKKNYTFIKEIEKNG